MSYMDEVDSVLNQIEELLVPFAEAIDAGDREKASEILAEYKALLLSI